MGLTKHRIQDESALKTVLELQSASLVQTAILELQEAYNEYRRQRRWVLFGAAGPFLLFGLMIVLGEAITMPEAVGAGVSFFIFLTFLYCVVRYVLPAALGLVRFSQKVDAVLFAPAAVIAGLENVKVTDTLGASQSSSSDSGTYSLVSLVTRLRNIQALRQAVAEPVIARLTVSELITESFNRTTVEVVCSGTIQGTTVTVAELDVKHETGSGKNRTVKDIFHGYFVECTLKKPLSGKTFVTTEHDKSGFGNISAFSRSAPRETLLEWNDFEHLLHVATTDEVEARYILTPDLMSDLYDWWHGRSEQIRLSFIGDRLYILYPDDRIRIGETIKELDEPALTEHLLTIARPLLHVVHLVEDVRL
jgi:hypothetical protein